ncbi:MAG: leucine-rich repeat domain-containing protein [Bacteroidetes bacterium]|nr:leucine-rich repeat domain-containing protein [Bacteroidota bacterium]
MPECIGNLKHLQKLDLRNNLIGTLPVGFTQLKSLQWLDLKANDFQSLPLGFENLSQLQELNLSMNLKWNFSAEQNTLKKMTQLQFLDVSYNNIAKDSVEPLREALPNCKVINWDYSKRTLPQPSQMRNGPDRR